MKNIQRMISMNSTHLAWKIRRHAIEMTHMSGGSHIGAVLSVADILSVLYADILHFRPADPKWVDRDRFVLSKGHAGIAQYAALAECGFFPVAELMTYYQNSSRLSGHVSHLVPGVELSTGSLGHGLGVAVGMAVAAKQRHKNHRIYCVLGDGECNEGSVWEAAQAASHYGLGNLIAIVDHNNLQSLDFCPRTQHSGPLSSKWRSFGWIVLEVNGHDHGQLYSALSEMTSEQPTVLIAHTVKGYPIPFMENNILWHYRYPHDGWEYDQAVTVLHGCKPPEVEDIYTPGGICHPAAPSEKDDIFQDHTMGATYHPSWYHVQEIRP